MSLRAVPAVAPPYATAALSGCGGAIRRTTADFRVEELPAYEPAGTGEHLFLWIEKEGITTLRLAGRLAEALGLPATAVGYAGLKDARAVTRQWMSLHTPLDALPEPAPGEGWRVLQASRHLNKLRPGHLRGNRFEIVIREIREGAPVGEILQRLAARGFPNYFGPQRFGRAGDNAARGRAILLGQERKRLPLTRSRLLVNAYQSELFNRLVALRLLHYPDPARMLAGDLAVLHRNGASFPVNEAGLADAQERADAGELSASAPLFGYRVSLAAGEPGAWEQALLAEEELGAEAFRTGGKRHAPKGERRPVRALPSGVAWELESQGALTSLRLGFTLPPGVYATSLLREVMKAEPDPAIPTEPEAD